MLLPAEYRGGDRSIDISLFQPVLVDTGEDEDEDKERTVSVLIQLVASPPASGQSSS